MNRTEQIAGREDRPTLNRRVLLAISIVISIALHATLIAVSDRVSLLALASSRAQPVELFRVDLVHEIQKLPQVPPPSGASKGAAPATVEELLERELEHLEPDSLSLLASVEMPQLAERLAREDLDREHLLARDEEVFRKIDAKVVEIAESEARRDIEVPRRLVRPSSARVVGEDEYPVFGGENDAELLPLRGSSMSSFGSEGVGGPAGGLQASAETALTAEREGMPILELPPERIDLPVERQMASAPLAKELRAENPHEFLDDLLDIEVSSYIPPDEKLGYFRLRVAPKKGAKIDVLPKDVTFVVDASNSIAQRKLDTTLAGLKASIALLRPEDRFNVVIFRDSPKPFQADRVPATEANKAAALAFLDGQKSFGETDIFEAIRPVVDTPVRKGYPGMMFVISDGRPTTGVKDGRTIINLLTDENETRNPIYAYAGGRTANRYLLDLLAYRNKGESYISAGIETMGKDLPGFFAQLNDPILTDLQANYVNVDESSIYPEELPDFYRGRAVTVYGRFDPANENEFAMRLAGTAGPRTKEVIFKTDLKSAKTGDAQIARNWAFRKTYALIGEICRDGETPERQAELRRLSQRYGIKTSYNE